MRFCLFLKDEHRQLFAGLSIYTVEDKTLQTAFRLYDFAWGIAIPLLRNAPRLKDGFTGRTLEEPLPEADIWIQAASGGEAFLARTLLSRLRTAGTTRVLVTTNTRQGKDIIDGFIPEITQANPTLCVFSAWFPFDRPSVMSAAAARVNPKLAVLLESELWPGFIHALKQMKRPVYIVNGRMTEKSLSGYRRFPAVCRALAPDAVFAVSKEDKRRFETVFGGGLASVMSNIKFDSLPAPAADTYDGRDPGWTGRLLPEKSPFIVLGSVRREEEGHILDIIRRVTMKRPGAVIGLFPRHMERVDSWKKMLSEQQIPWQLRSAGFQSIRPGDVVLWDVFGELASAYAEAQAVFVGGSLAPLGGQNFLEPLAHGKTPVIGPSWENFAWVGVEIFRNKLVIRVNNSKEAAEQLIGLADNPPPGANTAARAGRYIAARQGGARKACELIEKALIASASTISERNRS